MQLNLTERRLAFSVHAQCNARPSTEPKPSFTQAAQVVKQLTEFEVRKLEIVRTRRSPHGLQVFALVHDLGNRVHTRNYYC